MYKGPDEITMIAFVNLLNWREISLPRKDIFYVLLDIMSLQNVTTEIRFNTYLCTTWKKWNWKI